jgi:hypothetical protein
MNSAWILVSLCNSHAAFRHKSNASDGMFNTVAGAWGCSWHVRNTQTRSTTALQILTGATVERNCDVCSLLAPACRLRDELERVQCVLMRTARPSRKTSRMIYGKLSGNLPVLKWTLQNTIWVRECNSSLPWRFRQCTPSKRWYPSTRLHCVISRKITMNQYRHEKLNLNIQSALCTGLLDVQNILSADTGISRKIEIYSFGDHLSIDSVSVTSSSVMEDSIVLCSVSLWLVWINARTISLPSEHPISGLGKRPVALSCEQDMSLGPIKGGQCRRRWNDNIEIGIKEMGYEDVDWIHLVWDRPNLANTLLSFRVL